MVVRPLQDFVPMAKARTFAHVILHFEHAIEQASQRIIPKMLVPIFRLCGFRFLNSLINKDFTDLKKEANFREFTFKVQNNPTAYH